MKTSKAAAQKPAQEECGVWLDTVQLKGKAKQKRLARPISKLLNPFAESGGYSLAVALNFTQTKMEMPKTKQSSLSTFFTPYRRVLHKMSSSEVPHQNPVKFFSSSTLTAPSERKRKHEACLKKPDLYDSDSGVDWESENVMEPMLRQKQKQALNMYFQSEEEQTEDCNPPQSKRKLTDGSVLLDEDQSPPLAWSQDPLLTCSQYSESDFNLMDQKCNTVKNFSSSDTTFLHSVQSEGAFGNLKDMKGRTSTQKSVEPNSSCQIDVDKENSRSLSSFSPIKNSSFSPLGPSLKYKWMEPKTTSPQKRTDHPWNKAGKEVCVESKRTKMSLTPLRQRSREYDEDSLAMLFTQDSEGFRVMAHRGLQARSPLKDQSNLGTGMVRAHAYRSAVVEEEGEEEDEMLFTQDSQGNMVIKH